MVTGNTAAPQVRRRWDTKRRIAILIVGLALLLLGVDAVARMVFQAQVEARLQDFTQVSVRPDVKARGLFFLPQLIRGGYREVDVSTRDVVSGDLLLREVNAQLFDVRVPFHDVLVGEVGAVGIGHSEVRARLPYSDINAYFKATDRPLTLSPGPDGEVQVTGEIVVGGLPISAHGQVSLSVENGAVTATPRQIDTGAGALDQASRLLLGDRLSFTLPIDELPYGQHITAATPYNEGIEVEAQGAGVVLHQP